jgi:hypothetical protein
MYATGQVLKEIRESLVRYAHEHVATGGFLHAVLTNDLIRAIQVADPGNFQSLPAIIDYCLQLLPSQAWGSPDAVNQWLKEKP